MLGLVFFQTGVFDYTFLDEAYAAQYRKDKITTQFFNYFTLLAIFISCLGLYALIALTITQRVKELGVRKVLGASTMHIVRLLSNDFVKLICVAILIASPVAWWMMNRWLANFAYRMDIPWWIFVVAGLVAMIIALLTLSWQAVRASLANPVESLRDD
ncbi:FtsX-like permease family protein [Olivibacter sp. 47]|uniref:ABC transporter permease n=1 Tax=Olivibacter sp. 47 TaxID=3056486 RepID=UPI0025A3A86F|nr:FtsX-like permease family protein [Olivibacter sp. 47]MDM8173035.1 FtsX-like permease family protein [Olivibacter sp. 47]